MSGLVKSAECTVPQRRTVSTSAKAALAKGGLVRNFPVHAWCSEKWVILNLPFVAHGAKVPKEPKIPNATQRLNGDLVDLERRSSWG